MKRPCRTGDPRSMAFSGGSPLWKTRQIKIMSIDDESVAAARAADVVAEGVELANPAAALIAVIVIGVAGRDRAADGGAEQSGADAPAMVEAMRFGGRGGGCDGAGDGKRGNGESGNPGLDRHDDDLHPVECGPLWSACRLDGGFSIPVRRFRPEISVR